MIQRHCKTLDHRNLSFQQLSINRYLNRCLNYFIELELVLDHQLEA